MLVVVLGLLRLGTLDDEMSVLLALLAHARAPLRTLAVHVHALKPPTQQCEPST
jgi:hypothetical protein